MAQYQANNRLRLNKQACIRDQARREKTPLYRKDYQIEYRNALKAAVLLAYGGKCYCCGLDDSRFLTVDHINNNGGQHRRQMKFGGAGFYRWIVKNWVPDDLRLACHNCNCYRGRRGGSGLCAHEEDRQSSTE